MTDHVDQTLRLWRTVPFKWGGSVPHVAGSGDCLLSLGEYMAGRDGKDVAGGFRGTYTDEAGALAHVTGAGGSVALVDRHGWNETDSPARGDVAVIDVGGAGVGALCTGEGFACRLERGVVEINSRFVRILKAWSCPL